MTVKNRIYFIFKGSENIALAYIPELAIFVGSKAASSGRIGLGRDFWELKQTLAATMYSDDARINANFIRPRS